MHQPINGRDMALQGIDKHTVLEANDVTPIRQLKSQSTDYK